MLSVFVSFAEEDKGIVSRLQAAAVSRGDIRLYRYDHVRTPGMPIATKIREAIVQADVMAVLLTKHSKGSEWINHEIGAAHALHKRVIPIMVAGAQLPPLLIGVEALMLDPSDPGGSIARTADYLKQIQIEKVRQELGVLMGLALLVLVLK